MSFLDKRCECDTYNLTSQAEEDDDEVITPMRKRIKKGIPEGFVRNGMFLILKYLMHLKYKIG